LQHTDVLTQVIEEALAGMTRDEVETLLESFQVPVGAVRTMDEVLTVEEANEGGMVQHGDYAGREVRYLGSPIKINRDRIVGDGRRPPHLGEHADELLSELGLSADEIGSLRAAGVLGG
jgi:crotonobetainyl-CoA:carnitine CoA-transferase CaiB-like acyl-CoA transferase